MKNLVFFAMLVALAIIPAQPANAQTTGTPATGIFVDLDDDSSLVVVALEFLDSCVSKGAEMHQFLSLSRVPAHLSGSDGDTLWERSLYKGDLLYKEGGGGTGDTAPLWFELHVLTIGLTSYWSPCVAWAEVSTGDQKMEFSLSSDSESSEDNKWQCFNIVDYNFKEVIESGLKELNEKK